MGKSKIDELSCLYETRVEAMQEYIDKILDKVQVYIDLIIVIPSFEDRLFIIQNLTLLSRLIDKKYNGKFLSLIDLIVNSNWEIPTYQIDSTFMIIKSFMEKINSNKRHWVNYSASLNLVSIA